MRVEIISIGNELLNGSTVNSNAAYMCKRLHETGITTDRVVAIGDSPDAIREALKVALGRSDVILTTGGLGPTPDDITKEVIAEFFGQKLVFDEEIYREIQERFAKRGIRLPEVNRAQAYVPENCQLIPNPAGTARGLLFRPGDKIVIAMPGVPMEMKAMMEQTVLGLLAEKCPTCQVKVDLFRTTGIAESTIYQRIKERLPDFSTYELAFLPKYAGVDLRIVRKAEDIHNREKFEDFKKLLFSTIGEYIYTTKDKDLAAVIGGLLREKGFSIAVSESLTGGLVGDKLTNVPGSSDYFMGGVVAYSNTAKHELLGVLEKSLEEYGAVSDPVAGEMAAGVRRKFNTSIGLSTTGIAGPTGATETKPVGLVFIGLAFEEKVMAKKFQFGPDRFVNKQRSAQAALDLVRRAILGLPVK